MLPAGYAEAQARRKRRIQGFFRSRYKFVKEATSKMSWALDPNFNKALTLPRMPAWYGKYRASAAWKTIELDMRRSLGPICHDCHKFRRINLFHTDATRIWPHDPAAIIALCQSCRDFRDNISHRIIKIQPLHGKVAVRKHNFPDV